MRPRTVLFRLPASRRVGWGHLARCAALAQEMRERGWKTILCVPAELKATPSDMPRSFDLVRLGETEWFERPPDEAREAEWIVVDDPGAGDDHIRQLANAVQAGRGDSRPRLLVIDDEGKRRLDAANLILNTRLGMTRSSYAGEVPALLGSSYALLRPGLRAPAPVVSPIPARTDGVLVMLGGTDPRGFTPHALEALAATDPSRVFPVVVHSKDHPGAALVREALDRFPGGAWLENLPASSLAGWAAACRYAIAAAGGTLYELAYLRLPFVAIVVAENQRDFAHAVRRHWAMPLVDPAGSVRESVTDAFRVLLRGNRSVWRGRLAAAGIDGRGAARVVDAMER